MPHITRRTLLKLSAATCLAGLATVTLGSVPSASAQHDTKALFDAFGENAPSARRGTGAAGLVIGGFKYGKPVPVHASYQQLCQYII